jgi:ABC-type glutathione transport system ATPase component
MTKPLLRTLDLTKAFRHKTGFFAKATNQLAVNAISLDLARRERIGIVGESGSGKSTLGRLLLGLTPPTNGDVWFEGINHRERSAHDWKQFRVHTSLVQQNPLSALNPQMTIGQQVAEGLLVHHVADRRGAYERAAAMLERVGLSSPMMNRYPHQMSGGQRQRVVPCRRKQGAP